MNLTRNENNGELVGTRAPTNRDLILPAEIIPELESWGITGYGDSPVSPPGSPRDPEDEDDEGGEDITFAPYIIIRGLSFDLLARDLPSYPKKRYAKNATRDKTRNKTVKDMRRRGMLKQPGGASCNQRR